LATIYALCALAIVLCDGSNERANLAMAAQQAAEQKSNALRQRLIELGIDPDSITGGESEVVDHY
jgi:hypothetical protein